MTLRSTSYRNDLRSVLAAMTLAIAGGSVGALTYSTLDYPVPVGQPTFIRDKESGAVSLVQVRERQPVPLSGLARVMGAAGLATAAAIATNQRFTTDDLLDGIETTVEGSARLVGDLVESFTGAAGAAAPKAGRVLVRFLPPKIKTLIEQKVEALTDDDWFEDFLKRSMMIVGRSGSGKTVLLLYLVILFYTRTDGLGHLKIIDTNYGKPNERGERNFWFELPKGQVVMTSYDEAVTAINEAWEELNRRKAQCKDPAAKVDFHDWMLLVDEWIDVVNTAGRKGKDELEALVAMVEDLLTQGRGYRVWVVVGSQTFQVQHNHLTTGILDQFNVALLGASALDSKNLQYVTGVGRPDATIAELQDVRSQPGCQFAAIVSTHKGAAVRVVPELDLSQYSLAVDGATDDPELAWWQAVYTAAIADEIQTLADQYAAGEIKSPLRDICRRFGVPKPDGRYSRYTRFIRPAWDQAVKNAQFVEVTNDG